MFLNFFVLFLVINCVFYLFVKTSNFNLFDYMHTYTFLFSIKILQTTITSMEKRGHVSRVFLITELLKYTLINHINGALAFKINLKLLLLLLFIIIIDSQIP